MAPISFNMHWLFIGADRARAGDRSLYPRLGVMPLATLTSGLVGAAEGQPDGWRHWSAALWFGRRCQFDVRLR